MGNSFGCSASGERLVSAARDGDLVEARALLEFNPLLARYSTFGALNSPLHFAAAKGHNEIVNLLLEHGADVNIRNYCGQTALMQACRYGHWEVVQTLLLYKGNVSRADYLNRRTAFHFAAVNGHARCIRLLVSDYIPSVPYRWSNSASLAKGGELSPGKAQADQIALSKLVSKAADGGITALHLAALNGHFDCVQLLLDLLANVSATTFHYGTAIDLIGAGSTPLHYAACGGSLQCCQALIARGASRTSLNCNGWIPWDVAHVWGRNGLESLLAPNSQLPVPSFPTSRFLSLPLMSIMQIARDQGLGSGETLPEGSSDHCAVCLEFKCTVAAEGCGHELCTKCALYLCSTSSTSTGVSGPPGSVPCPLCRHGIVSFTRAEKQSQLNNEVTASCSLGGLCASYPMDLSSDGGKRSSSLLNIATSKSSRNRISPLSAEAFRAVTCTGAFSGLNLSLCTCNKPPLKNQSLSCEADRRCLESVLSVIIGENNEASTHLEGATADEEGHSSPPGCNFTIIPSWRCPVACQGSSS
ncbi:hypothetical protein GOP47_0011049 [Adiantum capillus-veneris]|uniref:RING-type E3 ubiquitin transferase n=1 Tax=Adiantum capillus-veneris TaxID=13818 RepID=A0A9D4USJ9_ADICA|nr:hypothetical protein GOP47_0011049 [Adiantum capillus-veneris]